MDRTYVPYRHPQPNLTTDDVSDLSRREGAVLHLVAQGWETQRIAARPGISLHTVRIHIRNLRHRFRANSKLDAVVKGLRLGLVSVERSS